MSDNTQVTSPVASASVLTPAPAAAAPSFSDLGVPAFLVESLARMQITVPSKIQAESIPPALQGRDILASAQTGSGKTIAFLMPLIMNLINSPQSKALILLPTRELATQVCDALNLILGRNSTMRTAVLIGGAHIGRQFDALRKRPRIVIGTPGRICDHLERRSLDLKDTNFLVLDEMDRMLDMGFSDELNRIVQDLPKPRQTFMFSATLASNVERLAQQYLTNPERIAIGSALQAAKEIKQEVLHTSMTDKFDHLVRELKQREGSILIFVKTKRSADQLAIRLRDASHTAEAIHGDLQQRKREAVILAFRRQKSRILVATDVAARGLDVPHIQHVINFDLPMSPEDYIHRIGRTGRAGATGSALSFIAPDEARKWRIIHQYMNPGAPRSSFGGNDSDRGGRPGRTGRAGGARPGSAHPNSYSRHPGRPGAARAGSSGSRFEHGRSEGARSEGRSGRPGNAARPARAAAPSFNRGQSSRSKKS